jgi:translation elongation factor EF-Ts
VQDAVINFASTVRENIKLRRGVAIEGPVVGTYLHTSPAPGVARMAAAVALDGQGLAAAAPAAVSELAHKLAMHAVAARPAYLDRAQVPEHVLHGASIMS